MSHLQIFFDPSHQFSHTDKVVKNEKNDLSPVEDQKRAHHLLLPPHGPHAIFQFPKDTQVGLVSSYEWKDSCRPNFEDKETCKEIQEFLTFEKAFLRVEGEKGSLFLDCRPFLESCTLYFSQSNRQDTKETSSEKRRPQTNLVVRVNNRRASTVRLFHLLCRRLSNLSHGLSSGFVRRLLLAGIGNKVSVHLPSQESHDSFSPQGQILRFTTGLSHPISVQLPSSLRATCETPTHITLFGLNKDEVYQWASRLRYTIFRRNVYSKPIIQFEGENVSRKETRKK